MKKGLIYFDLEALPQVNEHNTKSRRYKIRHFKGLIAHPGFPYK